MAGTLDMPDTEPEAFAIFAHCFVGSRFTPAAARTSKQLAQMGIACLRFDFPGLGQSEGNFAETSFSENVEDIIAANNWLTQHYSAPQLLVGHSLGGAASLKAATKIKNLKAIATIGAPFDPAHAVLHFADRIGEVDEAGSVTLNLGGREIVMSREYLEDLAETNVESYLPKLRKPLLVMHSPIDQTVGIDNAIKIYTLTRYPKSLISLHKVDHLVTRPGAAQEAAKMIYTWVKQHIVPENTEYNSDVIPEGVAIATSTKAGKYTDIIRTGTRMLETDKEKAQGGKNLGYSPTSLIVSALAAATSQAIRHAAREGKITGLDDVQVSVSRTLSSDNKVHLRREITLIGQLTDEQRQELLTAASHNEVQDMLSGNTMIQDEIKK
nr:alpha/beta fold hydrolase [Corynebacterium sp. sy017]